MTYDPRDFGADCDACPLRLLRDGEPVCPEYHSRARAVLVGEAPGLEEVREGAPFVGRSGQELLRALGVVGGGRRRDFSFTNAILCRPPDNKLEPILHKIQKENKKRAAAGKPLLKSPIECCRPRLVKELQYLGNDHVIALGGTALHAITNGHDSPMESRGGPREVQLGNVTIKLMPTLHPSYVMRARRWTFAFQSDLSKALRWFKSGLGWRDPEWKFAPSAEYLRRFLFELYNPAFWVYDVETFAAFPEWDIFDPLFDKLGLVGICTGDGKHAVVVPFKSKEDKSRTFYHPAEFRKVKDLLREFFLSPVHLKAGWNEGYYDQMVIKSNLGVTPDPIVDGILLHKFVEPELYHNLGYVGTTRTDIHSWKQGHVATEAKSDAEWSVYNARDTAVTALVIPQLVKAVKERSQTQCIAPAHKIQQVCVGLHENGMLIDQAKRREWDSKLLKEAQESKAKAQHIAARHGARSFNPGSTAQVTDLLFERWGLLPVDYTEMGDPSTADSCLCEMLINYELTQDQRDLITSVRTFREKVKWRGTYTLKMRKINEPTVAEDLAWDIDEPEEERASRLKKLQDRPGRVLPDGRVHPDYNAHTVLGWRLSSSGAINAQNFPAELRDMIVAQPGHALVGCDQAQLELRMVVGLAKAAKYLEKFVARADPHYDLCVDFFGDKFLKASKKDKKKLRVFVKEFTYASLYRALIETRWKNLKLKESANKFIFPHLKLEEIAAFDRIWHQRNPEIQIWWDSLMTEFRATGCLREPVWGARCDFLDGEDEKKLANFKPQAGGAAIVHLATFDLLEEVPFQKWGPGTGLIEQAHDQLVIEVPAEHPGPQLVYKDEEGNEVKKWCKDPSCQCTPSRMAKFLEKCMTIDGTPYGMPILFEGEAAIGNNWREV